MRHSTTSRATFPWLAAACALLLGGLTAADPAAAQTGRSGLFITAVDEAGEPIPDLELAVRPAEGTAGSPRTVTTNRRGQAALRFMSSGHYRIDVADRDRYYLESAEGEIRDATNIFLTDFEYRAHPVHGLDPLPVQGANRTMVTVVVTDAEVGERLRRQLAGQEAQEELEALVALYEARRFEDVVVAAEALLADSPDLPDALHLKGLAHSRLGDEAEAEALLRRAAELEPELGEYSASLGTFLLEKGGRQEAVDPGRAQATYEEAEGALRAAVEAMEEPPVQVLINHALALDKADCREEAIDLFHRIIERDPQNLGVYFRLAALYREQGEGERALEILEELPAADDPRVADSLYNVAVSFYNDQRYGEAKAALERVLEMNPDHGLSHRLMARSHLAEGQAAEAIPHLRRFLELEPGHPDAAEEEELLRLLERQLGAG